MTAGWQTGPQRPPALAADVHVWRTDLDGEADAVLELPEGERERAAQIRSERGRRRWVAARRALRIVLGRYLDEHPARIALHIGERGKPALAASPAPLRFNLSHSGALALIALTGDREVGVDVEEIRPDRDFGELARVGLDADAAAAVRSAAPDARAGVFYDAWVRQEAVAKCLGVGLGAAIPDGPVAVTPLDAGRSHAAAVAVAGKATAPPRRFQLVA